MEPQQMLVCLTGFSPHHVKPVTVKKTTTTQAEREDFWLQELMNSDKAEFHNKPTVTKTKRNHKTHFFHRLSVDLRKHLNDPPSERM